MTQRYLQQLHYDILLLVSSVSDDVGEIEKKKEKLKKRN